MFEFDVDTLAQQATQFGLLSREEVWEAKEAAEDGSVEAFTRALLRKGLLTSWQLDKLMKGEINGFFYGGCKVLFHIAEGTFARVYRGRRIHGNQSVAIKVLRRRFSTDRDAVARFNLEAEAGMKLVHPNIVRIYDFGEQEKSHYMIMEYVEGQNLRDFLRLRHRLSPHEAMPMIMGLARALHYSLKQGVTHRDIKGTNILIGSRGEAKLVDFGLATIEGDERRMERAHGTRTVDYSALERTCGSPKGDHRSDVYFLGCVFYQMLTGVLPLPEVESTDLLAKMLKRSFGAIRPLSEHRHAPPSELTRIIEKMMRIDLKQRYQTMDEVVTDLEAYQAQMGAPPPVPARRAHQVAVPASAEDDDMDIEKEFEAEMAAEPAPEPEELGPRNVLCVEVQDQIQNALRKNLSQMGYKVILVRSAELAAERYREAPPDAVVFDADGLGPEALDAFLDMHEKAHDEGHELSALVLLGPRQRDLVERLPTDDRLIVLVKPIKIKDVQEALAQLVPLTSS